MGCLVMIISAIVRYRYLTTYSRLPPENHREEPKTNFFMDANTGRDSKTGFSTYLEDFLSAIKIFGYLERPVFHELTREMRTYKLEQGETLTLDDAKGFYVVVDGTIQVLTKSQTDLQQSIRSHLERDTIEIDNQTYSLLNEVKRGAPVSSLIAVLSLFATAIKKDPPATGTWRDTGFGQEELEHNHPLEESPGNTSDRALMSDNVSGPTSQTSSHLENVLAYAVEDSTIAIIPQSAFHRVTRKYPKSTAHIVQVIMARLSRVTFQTGHHYLGLTPEIYETEVILNNNTKYELPTYLHDRAVNGIKEVIKLNPELASSNMVYLGKQKASRQTPVQPKTKSEFSDLASLPLRSRQVILEPNMSHPGDLLSNVPLSRREAYQDVHGNAARAIFSGEEETEDSALRVALTECIFKVFGLENSVHRNESFSITMTPQEMSPLITAVDEFGDKSRKTSFNNVLNNLSRIDRGSSTPRNDDDSIASSASPQYESAQIEAAQHLDIIFYQKGSILIEQNGDSCGIFHLIDGILEVGYRDKSGKYCELYCIKPGGIGGFIGAALSFKSFVEVRAKTKAYVGFLPRATLERISERYPSVLLSIANTLTSVLSDLILTLDFALEWVQIPGGQVLFKQGDDADAIYIVLNGRLRSVCQENGKTVKHGEYGQGDSIGELEVLTVTERPYTLHAIRDSELAKFPRTLFERLAKTHPSITIEISRIIASRLRNRLGAPSLSGYEAQPPSNFRTVSVIPITAGLPVAEFGQKLFTAYKDIKQNVVSLNFAAILHHLGRNAFNKIGQLKLSGHLADLEEKYQTVLYIADSNVNSLWTETCISQADCILLLANASSDTEIGEFERLLVTMKTTAKTELILLHEERLVSPGSTAKWLKNRIWVDSHHHVQFASSREHVDQAFSTNSRLTRLRNKVQSIQSELITKYKRGGVPIYSPSHGHKNDFCRLARILSGQAIGLVLGGGGARGISHIGVIRALEESGVPIDFVGGTSIGSFIGGLYAKEYDLVPIYGRAKQFASRVSSLWRMLFDLTYPATSYTTGHEFNRSVWKAFGDSQIEDFWLRYFANSTNITHSRMEIHKSGYSWRYIRASMSLAGLLPPLTDKGSMLLDGGYMDNLPVAEMKSLGAKYIFAVDVGSIDDTTPMKYGDSLSGIWVILNRWNIFSKYPNVPSLAEIQARLTYVSSVGTLEKAKNLPGVIYLRPPIDNYATLDFGKFDEIYRIGSQYAYEFVDNLKKDNKMPDIPGATPLKGKQQRPDMTRRNSI